MYICNHTSNITTLEPTWQQLYRKIHTVNVTEHIENNCWGLASKNAIALFVSELID